MESNCYLEQISGAWLTWFNEGVALVRRCCTFPIAEDLTIFADMPLSIYK